MSEGWVYLGKTDLLDKDKKVVDIVRVSKV